MIETAHHRKSQTDKNAMGVAGTPSTSFQTCTSGTPNAAPSTVAVRSLPPRPSVVIAPAATSPPALYKSFSCSQPAERTFHALLKQPSVIIGCRTTTPPQVRAYVL